MRAERSCCLVFLDTLMQTVADLGAVSQLSAWLEWAMSMCSLLCFGARTIATDG